MLCAVVKKPVTQGKSLVWQKLLRSGGDAAPADPVTLIHHILELPLLEYGAIASSLKDKYER